ncbi:TonB-dependent receptor [Puteibacter caeruleilacunae]|nr:TonB-dependent receptor [Puteibacter caeruleilacunae]
MRQILRGRFKKQLMVLCGLLLFIPSVLFAQDITVKGKVTDGKGESIPGANVIVKGTTNGTVTDFDGNYTIKVKDGSILVYTFIGFATKEVKLKGQKELNVELSEDFHQLEEVVAVGYGSMKKADLTGAVVSVGADDLQKAPVVNVEQALMGRAAGVRITSMDGRPGEGMSIEIRGGSSLGGNNTPLYVVDGFPMGEGEDAIESIDPNDIESVSVLKDASSTSIYGARGANGVVLITTKKGKNDESTEISYDGYYGMQIKPTDFPELLSAREWGELMHERYPNDEVYALYETYGDSVAVNWMDRILRNAAIQNHRVGLRGGSKKTRYSASVSYQNQEGIVLYSGYEKYNGRLNLDQKVNDKLSVDLSLSYTKTDQFGAPSLSGTTNDKLYTKAKTARPYIPANTNEDDDIYLDEELSTNPLAAIKATDKVTEKEIFNVNGAINYKITPDLVLRSTIGRNGVISHTKQFDTPPSYYGKIKNGRAVQSYRKSESIVNSNTVTFKKKVGKHDINAVAGLTFEKWNEERLGTSTSDFAFFNLGYNDMSVGTSFDAPTSSYKEWSMLSYLGRVNYIFNNKYLFTVAFRSDGSSRFADGNKWSAFPSAAISWRLSEEPFMESLGFLSNAKIRASFGETGNLRLDPYDSMARMNITKYGFGNGTVVGAVPASLSNSDLTWETTRQFDAGLDLGLFDNRVSVVLDYYHKRTNDMLLDGNIINVSGFGSMMMNMGTIENQGVELILSTVNINKKNFKWSTDFNISANRSKIIDLAQGQEAFFINRKYFKAGNAFIVKKGEAIGTMYGYVWDGVYNYDDFDTTGEGAQTSYSVKRNVPVSSTGAKPGDIKYKDLNGDGKIDTNDQTIIGNGNPVHYGGINNSFSYGNFDLSVFFEWSYGNDILNANRYRMESLDGKANQYATVLDRWQPIKYDDEGQVVDPGNQNTDMFREGGNKTHYYSDRVIEDGSYLRLKTVNLGYNFKKKFVKRLGISSLKVYVSGQNLWTLTNYSGLDPDVHADATSSPKKGLIKGVDFGAYPSASVVTFGLKVKL